MKNIGGKKQGLNPKFGGVKQQFIVATLQV